MSTNTRDIVTGDIEVSVEIDLNCLGKYSRGKASYL